MMPNLQVVLNIFVTKASRTYFLTFSLPIFFSAYLFVIEIISLRSLEPDFFGGGMVVEFELRALCLLGSTTCAFAF
jgi:hypothetical protein